MALAVILCVCVCPSRNMCVSLCHCVFPSHSTAATKTRSHKAPSYWVRLLLKLLACRTALVTSVTGFHLLQHACAPSVSGSVCVSVYTHVCPSAPVCTPSAHTHSPQRASACTTEVSLSTVPMSARRTQCSTRIQQALNTHPCPRAQD